MGTATKSPKQTYSQKAAGRGGNQQHGGDGRFTRGSQSRPLSPEPEKGGAGRNQVPAWNRLPASQHLKKCPPNPDNNIEKTKEHKELNDLLEGIQTNINEVISMLSEHAKNGVEAAKEAVTILNNVVEATTQAKEWAGKANSKATKSIKETRRENLKEVQKEVLIKNVSKNAPVENINRVKDAVLKHLKDEAKKAGMGNLNNNQVSVSRLSWTKVNRDGTKETKYGAHKVTINAKVEYRKLMFSNLARTTMRKDLGDKISIKNMVPKHLLARSKHLERVALKKRREDNLHTKVALKEGGLYLYTKRKGDRDWRQVKEEDLLLPVGERQDREEDEEDGTDT